MHIFSKGKTKKNKEQKKSFQKWLGKLIAPQNDKWIKPFRSGKIKSHIHSIAGVTTKAKGHRENISIDTGKPIMTKDGHLHEYRGAIYTEGKQVHVIEGVTSSASGQSHGHSHYITGRTSKDGSHAHKYKLETSSMKRSPEQNKQRIVRKQKAAVMPAAATVDTSPVELK